MKHVVVLTGAGISAESGLKTFRDGDGLWEGYEVTDVATPEAWQRDSELVQRFYNERRQGVIEASPNAAHRALVELEGGYRVSIITQNIDDLHERAGSDSVLHLHGEITKSQSVADCNMIYPIEGDTLNMGDLNEDGHQLRPHVVWFGEAVPMMEPAIDTARQADLFLVIGTSLVVYPAASLVDFVGDACPIYIVDPGQPSLPMTLNAAQSRTKFIQKCATEGVPELVSELLS